MDISKINIHITPELINSWKKELADLEEKIEQDRKKRELLIQRLHSLQFFVNGDPSQKAIFPYEQDDEPGCDMPHITVPTGRLSIKEMSPHKVISFWLREKIPNGNAVPVKYLRESIDSAGYPIERFGKQFGYFYTLLKRMEESGEIFRDGDKVGLKTGRI